MNDVNDGCTVGTYLVRRLQQLGLGHLFSIAGDYSIEWLDQYVQPSEIRLIQEVSELCAGYAADAYARLRGIGALCVTYSAGALSAVNCVAGAYVERVPMILINGTPSIAKTLTFEQTGLSAHHFISGRQTDLQVFEPITAAAIRLDNPDLAPMLIDTALVQCITEKRPIYIELLQDIVGMSCEPPSGVLKPGRTLSTEASLAASVDEISAALAKAERPLMWVGVEVDRMGIQGATERLIHDLKIPFVTELLSKGVLPENDALFAGVFDGRASSLYASDAVENADFILALGVWLTDINSIGWNPEYGKIAFVSQDTVKFGTFFSAQVSLDHFVDRLLAKKVVTGMQGELPAKPARNPAVHGASEAIGYQGFYDAVAANIGPGVIGGSDASLNYFGSLLLEIDREGGFIAQSSYSAIGYIGPAATGMCLATDGRQRVIVFSGDGGFQMTAQCLSTQTRFGLNPIIFVIDNGVYGVEQWLADATVFKNGNTKPFYRSCLLHRWNYSELADVFGCKGWKVTTYGQLSAAFAAALANDQSPSLIQVVVDSRSAPDNAMWKAG